MKPQLPTKHTHCQNCETELQGNFCHTCGQEDKVIKEDVKSLIKESVEDLTFFNSKIWITLKLLITNPSKLSRLYLDGKRASFVAPFKLYLFLVMIFSFLDYHISDRDIINAESPTVLADTIVITPTDTTIITPTDTTAKNNATYFEEGGSWLNQKFYAMELKYKNDPDALSEEFKSKFRNNIPYLLYISIPLIAVFLLLLYRRKKKFFYVEHLTLTLYLFSLIALLLIAELLLDGLFYNILGLSIPFELIVFIAIELLIFRGMHRFYNNSRRRTFVKLFALNLMTFLLTIVLLVFGFIITIFLI